MCSTGKNDTLSLSIHLILLLFNVYLLLYRWKRYHPKKRYFEMITGREKRFINCKICVTHQNFTISKITFDSELFRLSAFLIMSRYHFFPYIAANYYPERTSAYVICRYDLNNTFLLLLMFNNKENVLII